MSIPSFLSHKLIMILAFSLSLCSVLFAYADGNSACPVGSTCVLYQQCKLQEKPYQSCDSKSVKICCPQSSLVNGNSKQPVYDSYSFVRPPVYSGIEKPQTGPISYLQRPVVYTEPEKNTYGSRPVARPVNPERPQSYVQREYVKPIVHASTKNTISYGSADYGRPPFQSSYEKPTTSRPAGNYARPEVGETSYSEDYYESSYRGPISSEASSYLQTFKYNEECGVRGSVHYDRGNYRDDHSRHRANDLGVTKFGEFPWQAAILAKLERNVAAGYGQTEYEYRQPFKFLCGATVIGPSLILTAAHCVEGIKTSILKVKLGIRNLHGHSAEMFPAIERGVSRTIVHESYNRASFRHDIALLVLNKPVDLRKTPHVSPACLLPKKFKKFEEFSKCFIAGWGLDPSQPNYGSDVLKLASVSLLKAECKQMLKIAMPMLSDKFFNNDDIICIIKGAGKDACTGDGGGAVVCPISNRKIPVCRDGYSCREEHYFVAGIISWGTEPCGQVNSSINVVTNILSHREWIDNHARPYRAVETFSDRNSYSSRFRNDNAQNTYRSTEHNDRYANVKEYKDYYEQAADKYVYGNDENYDDRIAEDGNYPYSYRSDESYGSNSHEGDV